MRVATISIHANSQYQLGKTLSSYNEASSVVSTGKKIQHPSDDPAGYAQTMQIDASLSHLDQLQRNIVTGKTWLSTSESAVDSIRETILDAKDLALTMSNDSYNEEDRISAAGQVHELLETLIDYANSQVNGQYIFAGTKTDTCPYRIDETTDPPTAVYAGNDAVFSISTGTNARTTVGYCGNAIFGDTNTGEDIFSVLIQMEEDLRSSNGSGLAGIMEDLDAHYEIAVNAISDMGAKTLRLETKEAVITDLNLTLSDTRSRLEDADLTEAITDLALKQTAYEAALSATSSIISLSLVDYL